MFSRLGRDVLQACQGAGAAILMLASAAAYIPTVFHPRARREAVMQMYVAGIKSLGVITVVAFFTGMILALQTGLILRQYGQEVNIGMLVMEVMIREMGPMMAGLIIAASVGSSIAAQLGTMAVSEEIAALEVMSIAPNRFLVMPRLVALAVMMPLLTVYTNLIGLLGGGVVGKTQLGVAFQAYMDNAIQYAVNKDLYTGLFKATVFGVIIATVACYQGMTTRNGAVGVGRATRLSVVISFLLILIIGYMITRIFYV